MHTIVKLFLASLLLVCGSVHAENEKNPFYNGTIKISGMNQSSFDEAVHQYELKGHMTPSSQKELGRLFACFDTDNSGVIEAEEADSLFGKKKKKKKKGGGDGGTTCEYNTCDCTVIGDGQIVTPEGTGGSTDPGLPSDSGTRSPTWCGANCHCHCNTFTCARDGT